MIKINMRTNGDLRYTLVCSSNYIHPFNGYLEKVKSHHNMTAKSIIILSKHYSIYSDLKIGNQQHFM
jgi:hypothetical protein